jgi:hypothetical protein
VKCAILGHEPFLQEMGAVKWSVVYCYKLAKGPKLLFSKTDNVVVDSSSQALSPR